MARRQHLKLIACGLTAWLLVFLGAAPLAAADNDTALKVPRFVSLHSDKVNLRSGPGLQYPIEWVLTRKDMPVEVVAQFEHWRHIRAWDGTEGWVEEHMIDGKRFVVITAGSDHALHKEPDPASAVVARVEPGVIARLDACQGLWCRVEAGNVTGWLQRGEIWGVYPNEAVP
jgi:SH3-like domain-containing protein